MTTPLRGSCLCGGIRYQVDRIAPQIGHCHCSMCRKFHGAAFATLAGASREDFHWLRGEDMLQSYRAGNGTVRGFCKRCGASMTFAMAGDEGETIEFAVGTLDNPAMLSPDVHIYVDSKADWYDIDARLPRYRAGRDSDEISHH